MYNDIMQKVTAEAKNLTCYAYNESMYNYAGLKFSESWAWKIVSNQGREMHVFLTITEFSKDASFGQIPPFSTILCTTLSNHTNSPNLYGNETTRAKILIDQFRKFHGAASVVNRPL